MRKSVILTILVFGCPSDPGKMADVGRDLQDMRVRDASASDGGKDLGRDVDMTRTPDVGSDTGHDANADVTPDLEPRLSNALSQTTHQGQVMGLGLDIPTDATNALPFFTASYHMTEANLHYVHLDAVIENGALSLTRDEDPMIAGEFINVTGQVVALDPERFQVQCEYFQTGFLNATVSFPAFDPTRSFTLFWNKISTGSNNKSVAHFSTRFQNDDSVYLERFSPDGTALGHICLITTPVDAFSAQQVQGAIAIGETQSVMALTTPVELNRTVIFASHQATRVESKPGFSQISCQLQTDQVTCERSLNENEILDVRVQVVAFADRTTVQHLTVTIPDGTAEVVIDAPGTRPDDVVLLGQIGVLGEVATTADDKAFVPSSYVEAIPGTDTVTFRRGEPHVGEMIFYPQIVTF